MSEQKTDRYADLNLLPIAGKWREGRAGKALQDTNPYSGETLLQIEQANREDLNEAYAAAQEAQVAWKEMGPAQRSGIMLRAVQIFDERKEEIIEWIIKESGSTRIKAQIEWGLRVASPWNRLRSLHVSMAAFCPPMFQVKRTAFTANHWALSA